MVQHWADLERAKASINSAGALGHFLWLLAVIFAAVGVIGDAANIKLGLTPGSWLLLAVVASILSVPVFIGLALAWYLKTSA